MIIFRLAKISEDIGGSELDFGADATRWYIREAKGGQMEKDH